MATEPAQALAPICSTPAEGAPRTDIPEEQAADARTAPSTGNPDSEQAAGPSLNGGGDADAPAPMAAPALSRSQQKKQAKRALIAERRAARKAEEKAARRMRQEEKLKDAKERLAQMTPEEKAAWNKQRLEKQQARKQGGQEKKARLQQALTDGQRIIIDLDFEDKMSEVQVRSLCHQLLHTYAANGRAEKPAHLIFTSLKGGIGEAVRKHAPGFDNWVLTSHEADYMSVYKDEAEDLMYLTGDSPDELEDLEPGKAYIIGGLVDRNQHKKLCLEKAAAQGIATTRLPIGAHLKMAGSPILTVNQVFEILVKYGELQDWKAAFEAVVPLRKRADRDEGSDHNVAEGGATNGQASKKANTSNED